MEYKYILKRDTIKDDVEGLMSISKVLEKFNHIIIVPL